MIDWAALGVVALAAMAASALVVTSYALGLRLLSRRKGQKDSPLRRAGGIACFVVSAVAVLWGIYLIIPALH